MKAIERYRKIQELNKNEVPLNVWRLFECDNKYLRDQGISIMGDQISMGGDYMDIGEVKESFDWLVEQFGGVVLWDVE